MLATVVDGRVTQVRGAPDHPFTRGTLCVKVNDYEQRVYSPDRLLYPLRRTGPKGSDQLKRISWDEALDEIATRFRHAIDESGPQSILPFSSLGAQGILNGMNTGDPFFNKLGATILERTQCGSGTSTACFMTLGPTTGLDPESFAYSRYIILWAANVVSTNLHLWPFITAARNRGAKLVVIDPVRTRTAEEADWHIAPRPGTDVALALGMIHEIIHQGLVDTDYVNRYTVGFEELKQRASEYTPKRVAEITGVPEAAIRQLASEYATTQPAAIRVGVALERHVGGGQAVRALASLPALVGAWRRPGGGTLQMTVWSFPLNWAELIHPEYIRPGTRVINQLQLGRALTGELEGPPIRALFVWNANPAVTTPDQVRVLKGLKREDLFTVVHEQFLTDTARHADIVLPATTQLEQYDVMYSWGSLYLHLNEPVIPPLGESVSNMELFRRLAARMGFTDECFRRSDEECAQRALDWSAPVLKGIDLKMLKEKGFVRLNVPPPESYAPHAEGNFPTPSGRCELMSSMAAQGDFVLPLLRQGSNEFQPGTPVDPLPAYQPQPMVESFPLILLTPKAHAFLNSTYGSSPRQRRQQGDLQVCMHPKDAASRSISNNQAVRLFNDSGSFQAVAMVTDTVQPGVVVAPYGHWLSFSHSNSTGNAVTAGHFSDMGRAPALTNTYVEIAPVGR